MLDAQEGREFLLYRCVRSGHTAIQLLSPSLCTDHESPNDHQNDKTSLGPLFRGTIKFGTASS